MLAKRPPIGTEETLEAATAEDVEAFYKRWYRPEETVIAVAGDADPYVLARLIEKYFGDWNVEGDVTPEPDFGDPTPPAGVAADNPVGETAVMVEPDLPRSPSRRRRASPEVSRRRAGDAAVCAAPTGPT